MQITVTISLEDSEPQTIEIPISQEALDQPTDTLIELLVQALDVMAIERPTIARFLHAA